MDDEWWQLLKGEFHNWKRPVASNTTPIIGNIKCEICNGTGVRQGGIGYGEYIQPKHAELNPNYKVAGDRDGS